MAYEGMDPDEVESLGRQINGEAGALQIIIQKLDGLVQSMSAHWQGADSTRFHAAYTGQYRGQMLKAHEQLHALADTAVRNAYDQRRVSN